MLLLKNYQTNIGELLSSRMFICSDNANCRRRYRRQNCRCGVMTRLRIRHFGFFLCRFGFSRLSIVCCRIFGFFVGIFGYPIIAYIENITLCSCGIAVRVQKFGVLFPCIFKQFFSADKIIFVFKVIIKTEILFFIIGDQQNIVSALSSVRYACS